MEFRQSELENLLRQTMNVKAQQRRPRHVKPTLFLAFNICRHFLFLLRRSHLAQVSYFHWQESVFMNPLQRLAVGRSVEWSAEYGVSRVDARRRLMTGCIIRDGTLARTVKITLQGL